MEHRLKSSEIDDLAAQWAAVVDRGATSREEEELRAWLALDRRHAGAFVKARAVAVHTERASALGPEFSATVAVPSPNRRSLFLQWGAAAAVACVALVAGLTLWSPTHEFSTRLGETRVVPLEDGSVITLNTASRVRVSFTGGQRSIDLVAGEALFDVAKDKLRPFVVTAGDTKVRAVGTSFTVTRLPGKPMEVLVQEGVVEVSREHATVTPSLRVAASNRAIAPKDSTIAALPVPASEIKRSLAWREGRIAFEGETLREASETFARYSDIHIVITDPRVANETIIGLFVSNDPVGFARAVALSLNLRVDVAATEVRLGRLAADAPH